MMGVDDQVILERSKQNGCVLEPCAEINGNVLFDSIEDIDTPTTSAVGVGNIKRSILCPITPTPCRENGDSGLINSTPLSIESPESSIPSGSNARKHGEAVALVLNDSPHTPNEGVFDPFAPGPDAMLLAPIFKRILIESRKIISRQLNFDDIDDLRAHKGNNIDADALSDQLLLESLYGALLEVFILNQSKEFLAESCSLESEGAIHTTTSLLPLVGAAEICPLELEGALHTPTSLPPLMGAAEICPGAPVKAGNGKSINIDPGLCRKLEF